MHRDTILSSVFKLFVTKNINVKIASTEQALFTIYAVRPSTAKIDRLDY